MNKKFKSLLSVPKPGKELRRINVKGYIREGNPVDSYFRLELINAAEAKNLQSNKFTTIDEFKQKAEKVKEECKKDPNKTQQLILGLFSDGEHAIYDAGFERHSNFLEQMYDEASSRYGSMYPDMYYTNKVINQLTNPENLESLHNKNKELEHTLNTEFEMNTIRTSPFSFKVKIKSDDNMPLTDTINNRSRVTQDNKTELLTMILKEKSNTIESPKNLISVSSIIDSMIRGTSINESVLKTRVIPPIAAAKMFSHDSPRSPNIMNMIEPINENVMKHLDENLPEEFGNLDVLTQDPQKIKDTIIKKLNQYKQNQLDPETDMARYDLLQKFKQMDTKEVPYQFAFMSLNKATFKGFENKKVISALEDLGKVMVGVGIEEHKARHGYTHFTNNPMEMLTMSPEGIITSCQSISVGGNLGVNEYNINTVSSLYNDGNDFIMYTKSPVNNIKRERMSLRYEPETKLFNNYEDLDGKIYSQDKIESHLRDFIDSNEKFSQSINGGDFDAITHIIDEFSFGDNINNHISNGEQTVTKAKEFTRTMDSRYDNIKESNDIDKWDDHISTESYEQSKISDNINESNGDIYDNLDEQKHDAKNDLDYQVFDEAQAPGSLLYGSPRDQAVYYTVKKESGDRNSFVKEFHRDIDDIFSKKSNEFSRVYGNFESLEEEYKSNFEYITDMYKKKFGREQK